MQPLHQFMEQQNSIPLGLQRLHILLAQFVMENIYVECDSLSDAYLQKNNTAMGISISFCKRSILDNIFMIWSDKSAELCLLQAGKGLSC